MNHVHTVRLLLIFLDGFEYDGDVIGGYAVGGRELPVSVQRDEGINVVTDCGVPDLAALDGFTSDE